MAVSSSPAVKAQHKNVSLFFSLSICLSLYLPPSRCKHHQNRSSPLRRSLSGPRGCKQNLRRSCCKQPPLPSVSAGVVPARYRRHIVPKGGSDRKTTPKQAATSVRFGISLATRCCLRKPHNVDVSTAASAYCIAGAASPFPDTVLLECHRVLSTSGWHDVIRASTRTARLRVFLLTRIRCG